MKNTLDSYFLVRSSHTRCYLEQALREVEAINTDNNTTYYTWLAQKMTDDRIIPAGLWLWVRSLFKKPKLETRPPVTVEEAKAWCDANVWYEHPAPPTGALFGTTFLWFDEVQRIRKMCRGFDAASGNNRSDVDMNMSVEDARILALVHTHFEILQKRRAAERDAVDEPAKET